MTPQLILATETKEPRDRNRKRASHAVAGAGCASRHPLPGPLVHHHHRPTWATGGGRSQGDDYSAAGAALATMRAATRDGRVLVTASEHEHEPELASVERLAQARERLSPATAAGPPTSAGPPAHPRCPQPRRSPAVTHRWLEIGRAHV